MGRLLYGAGNRSGLVCAGVTCTQVPYPRCVRQHDELNVGHHFELGQHPQLCKPLCTRVTPNSTPHSSPRSAPRSTPQWLSQPHKLSRRSTTAHARKLIRVSHAYCWPHVPWRAQTRDLHILAVRGRNEDHGRSLAHEIRLWTLDNARGRSGAPGDHVDAGGDVSRCATLCAAAGFYFAL